MLAQKPVWRFSETDNMMRWYYVSYRYTMICLLFNTHYTMHFALSRGAGCSFRMWFFFRTIKLRPWYGLRCAMPVFQYIFTCVYCCTYIKITCISTNVWVYKIFNETPRIKCRLDEKYNILNKHDPSRDSKWVIL